MAFNYSPMGVPFKLTPADMGSVDYGDALSAGLKRAFEPHKQSQELLGSMLENKTKSIQARYAEPLAQARLKSLHQSMENARIDRQMLNDALKFVSQASNPDEINPIKAGILKHKYGIDVYAQTPQQKRAAKIEDAKAEEENKSNQKKIDELEKGGQQLLNFSRDVAGLGELLDNGLSTGIVPSLENNAGFGAKDLGKFNEIALRLQAALGHEISGRGGIGAANLAGLGKPSQWRGESYNKGIVESMKQRTIEKYKQDAEEYKRISGKTYPYKLGDYFKNSTTKMYNQKGGIVDVPHDKVKGALERKWRLVDE